MLDLLPEHFSMTRMAFFWSSQGQKWGVPRVESRGGEALEGSRERWSWQILSEESWRRSKAQHDTIAKLLDLLLYNSALFKRHSLRVRNLLVPLHQSADSPQLTGLYERGFPDGAPAVCVLSYQRSTNRFPPGLRAQAGATHSFPAALLRCGQ
jgi:hypothetical protein